MKKLRNYASAASAPKAAGERSRQRAAEARPPFLADSRKMYAPAQGTADSGRDGAFPR
jgi:hypothetical protein